MPFVIVFLDLQMPELDGFLTAKAIRAEFGSDAPPIYAVSADLTKETREQCLKASIVDLIPKPLTAKTVAKILGKESLLPATASTIDEGDHWHLPSGLKSFVRKGMGERVRRILEIFLQDSADRLQRLMLALKAKDWKTVTDITHSLRGSDAQVGATSLANQCLRLEEFTNERQHVSIKRTMAMMVEFENVEKSVRSYLDEFVVNAEKIN
jgi:CheY-like chemotaxis protein